MIVKLEIIPNKLVEILPRAISEAGNTCKLLKVEPHNDELSNVTLEIPDLGFILTLGQWCGFLRLSDIVDSGSEEIKEGLQKVESFLEKTITPSDN